VPTLVEQVELRSCVSRSDLDVNSWWVAQVNRRTSRCYAVPTNVFVVVRVTKGVLVSGTQTGVSSSLLDQVERFGRGSNGARLWAEENAMASLSTERNSRKLFSGDKEGPHLRHLKQMHAAQDCRDQVEACGRQFDT
jgi:hypothetical protein